MEKNTEKKAGYSYGVMRQEFQGPIRVTAHTSLVVLAVTAVMVITVMLSKQKESWQGAGQAIWLSLGIGGALALLGLSLYLILTDSDFLLRRTEYGKALNRLGNAKALMAAIDEEMEKPFLEGANFALLQSWLLIRIIDAAWADPFRKRVIPIPRGHLIRAALQKEEKDGCWMKLECREGSFDVFVWKDEREALRQWLAGNGEKING